MRNGWLLTGVLICAAGLLAGCSKSTSVPEGVVSASITWLDDLRTQVTTSDYATAISTVKKIEEEGTVDATQISEYLALKARAQMGVSDFTAAKATIEELERGVDTPAVIHALRGELAMKSGDQATAKAEYAKARQLDSTIAIPRM